MPTVSNSSPLILYTKIGRLDLLQTIFDEILIPPAVRAEIVEARRGRLDAERIAIATWIRVRAVAGNDHLVAIRARLDPGEAEAIALALELGSDTLLLLDDLKGLRIARDLGVSVVGSGGVLVRAKELGLVTHIRPYLADLQAAGLHLGPAHETALLAVAGE